MTNPKNILPVLHLVRTGLASGLMTKEEVIDWADKIIIKDEQPDIFFIDLALSRSKSMNDTIHYINNYLNFEKPVIQGRPLLALLYKQYITGQINLEQTVSRLFRLNCDAVFTEREASYIYSIDNDYDCATNNIYGTIEDVEIEVTKFLNFYKEYSIESFENWEKLDLLVKNEIDKDIERQQEQDRLNKNNIINIEKPWWKFW